MKTYRQGQIDMFNRLYEVVEDGTEAAKKMGLDEDTQYIAGSLRLLKELSKIRAELEVTNK